MACPWHCGRCVEGQHGCHGATTVVKCRCASGSSVNWTLIDFVWIFQIVVVAFSLTEGAVSSGTLPGPVALAASPLLQGPCVWPPCHPAQPTPPWLLTLRHNCSNSGCASCWQRILCRCVLAVLQVLHDFAVLVLAECHTTERPQRPSCRASSCCASSALG